VSNDFNDAEYEDINDNSQNNIRGKALYFSTAQVAQVLGQPDSKIRYYTTVFDDILKITISNKQRRYLESDIEKLRFIIELKSQGMTVRQIQEYCSEVDFDMEKGIQVKESSPLSIQTLAKALLEEQQKEFAILKSEITDLILNKLSERDEKLKENIVEMVALTVDGIVEEKLSNTLSQIETQQKDLKDSIAITMTETIDNSLDHKLDSKLYQLTENITNQFKTHIDERELEYQKTNQEVIDRLKANMDETKEKYLQEQKENKKGLLGIFFGSKK
jgi:DNA-binding transcriptional MerR regulator